MASGRETNQASNHATQGTTFTQRRRRGSDARQGSGSNSDLPYNIFDNNDQGLVDNPFLHLDPGDIVVNARRFAETHNLRTLKEVFVKVGLVLQDPESFANVPDLTEEEKDHLRSDYTAPKGFWHQPKMLQITIIALCIAAVVQGWNQTGSNGANLNWPLQLLNVAPTNFTECTLRSSETWIFAGVNASPYLSASLVGCWLSDPLSEYFLGRRAVIFIAAIVILAASIGSAVSQTWEELLICRILLGLGMGSKASVVPVFAAEVSPAHLRGSLVMNWQLFDALGILLGFTANLALAPIGQTSWRWQMASSVIPTIPLITLIFVCPDSPRFLMKQGRYEKAYEALLLLRGRPILAAKELLYVHAQMAVESSLLSQGSAAVGPDAEEGCGGQDEGSPTEHAKRALWSARQIRSINYWQKLGQLFSKKRIRRAALAAVVVMVGQQLCGVNVLGFYSSTLYCYARDKGTSLSQSGSGSGSSKDPLNLRPLFLSWGLGLTNFIFAFPAYFLIDTKGRRWLLLVTLPFLAISMLAAGLSFLVEGKAQVPVIALWTYVFFFFYSWGMGPVPFTLSAEVFPLENRLVGMAFGVFFNMLGSGLLALFVPSLTNALTPIGMLCIFAGLNVVALILVFFFVRETAGAALPMNNTFGSKTTISLEEINYIFGVSTKMHAQYQRQVLLPWAWNFHISGPLKRLFTGKRSTEFESRPMKLHPWVVDGRRATQCDVSTENGEGST